MLLVTQCMCRLNYHFNTGEFCGLLSDGTSPNTSTANTPDSGDALDDAADTTSVGSGNKLIGLFF